MTGYQFAFTCPIDGSPIEPLVTGQPAAWSTRATAQCTECGTELIVAVSVVIGGKHPKVTEGRLEQLGRARAARSYA